VIPICESESVVVNNQLSQLPLEGVTVLDATSNIAGPFGGAILGDLGAKVIKIETPASDAARTMSPVEGDRSAYFHVVNRNKTAVTIDLKSESGRLFLDNLLDSADVLLTNFLPEKLAEYHLTAEELMAKRPRLIIGNLSSYGSEGPSSHFPGYDATVQARTGIMHVTGERSGDPVRVGVSVLDVGGGTWLALGILAALIKREKSGVGSVIETSLFETGASWVSYHLSAHQVTGEPSIRSGSSHPAFAPYGLFKTSDGQIMIGVGNNVIFARLCKVIERMELVSDPRFAENVDRVKNNEALEKEIEIALAAQSSKEWVERLAASGVPADHLALPEDLLHDGQAEAVDILVDYPDPTSHVKKIPGLPFRIDGKRPGIRVPAPHKNPSEAE
jgi:crotonobetainyl-CoA:carnitine CoA-transferase CaiB-like acyl-CoA transferase